jgi:hypothetical protein
LKQMEGLLFKVFHLLVRHGSPPWPSAVAVRPAETLEPHNY